MDTITIYSSSVINQFHLVFIQNFFLFILAQSKIWTTGSVVAGYFGGDYQTALQSPSCRAAHIMQSPGISKYGHLCG